MLLICIMNLQPTLTNNYLTIKPLQHCHYKSLFAIACNPLVWAQHPNPNRYKQAEFEVYFKGAMQSGGAFIILVTNTNEVVGCTRFYDFNTTTKNIFIGYTFVAINFWGSELNGATKKLLINYVFANNIDTVQFHIGKYNIRSQKAIAKIGATLIGEIEMPYFGEPTRPNFIYEVNKSSWLFY